MKKGDLAELKMEKMLCAGEETDKNLYSCTIAGYDENTEYIYMILQSGELTNLSLDAMYQCEIAADKGRLFCTGRIGERYCGREGKMVKFEIENGFYKINIKCVDKQMA